MLRHFMDMCQKPDGINSMQHGHCAAVGCSWHTVLSVYRLVTFTIAQPMVTLHYYYNNYNHLTASFPGQPG